MNRLLALIMLCGALALPALPVHADATGDLFEAATIGTASEVKATLSAGADPNARIGDAGFTPLHLAVIDKSNPSAWAAAIEEFTEDQMAAEMSSNPLVIKALTEGGADPGARDYAGKTPFDDAKNNEALKGTDAYRLLSEGRFE